MRSVIRTTLRWETSNFVMERTNLLTFGFIRFVFIRTENISLFPWRFDLSRRVWRNHRIMQQRDQKRNRISKVWFFFFFFSIFRVFSLITSNNTWRIKQYVNQMVCKTRSCHKGFGCVAFIHSFCCPLHEIWIRNLCFPSLLLHRSLRCLHLELVPSFCLRFLYELLLWKGSWPSYQRREFTFHQFFQTNSQR